MRNAYNPFLESNDITYRPMQHNMLVSVLARISFSKLNHSLLDILTVEILEGVNRPITCFHIPVGYRVNYAWRASDDEFL